MQNANTYVHFPITVVRLPTYKTIPGTPQRKFLQRRTRRYVKLRTNRTTTWIRETVKLRWCYLTGSYYEFT